MQPSLEMATIMANKVLAKMEPYDMVINEGVSDLNYNLLNWTG